MGKKTIKELSSHKFSIDISGANKIALDTLSDNMKMKYAPTINKLISGVCNLNPNVKQALLQFCKMQYNYIEELEGKAEKFEKADLKEQKDQYSELATLLNGGIDPNFSSADKMKKIKLKGGYLIIPSDWIVLNEEEASMYEYAGVVEVRRNAEFNDVPHFVFFNEYKRARDYNDVLKDKVNALCSKAYPRYKEIMEKQVVLQHDPNNPGGYLNAEEFRNAPFIGFFHLPDQGDEKDPTCGAMIIRTK